MWKVVQAAVFKGKFHGISQPFVGQDSPFYWESMFSSGEGENTETSPGKVAPLFHMLSSPEKEPIKEQQQEENDDDDVIDVDEVVRKGERSGSFLFPSKHSDDDGEDGVVGAEAKPVPVSPLQISPAPEEYYRLVPFTPYTPASPPKKPKDPNVSWHVPESFTSKGPDVVQALSDIYTDPRIVTSANLRQTRLPPRTKSTGNNSHSKNGKTLPAQATSVYSDRGRTVSGGGPGRSLRSKKRKRDETMKMSSSDQRPTRKGVRPVKHKRKRSGQQQKAGKNPTTEKTRSMSTSSEEELEVNSKKNAKNKRLFKISQNQDSKKEGLLKQTQSSPGEQDLVFEAKDFNAPCSFPLKNRAQSAPNVLYEELERTYSNSTGTRPSVSMSDVRDSHIDSSDVSSDFDQF